MRSTLTVFVCSTYSDLSRERDAVLDAVRRLQLQHDSMEFFGARAGQPIETCLAEVRRSNILVVIVGHRYGTIAPELGVSFSEAEYTEGFRLNKPCLVYMLDENVPVLPKDMERDPEKLRLLDQWKSTLQRRHTVASYRDSHNLALGVAADLSRTISDLDEVERIKKEKESRPTVSIPDELTELVAGAMKSGVAEAALLSSIRRAVSALVAEAQHAPAAAFLSYSAGDRDIVGEVARGLESAGIRVWFDQNKLVLGDSLVKEIERGLATADFIVFFVSESSVRSVWAKRELSAVIESRISKERGPYILPVLLDNAEPPPLLRDTVWLDMTDRNVDQAVQRLVAAMARHSTSR